MPIIKSAIKKLRQDKKRTRHNLTIKNRFKAAMRSFKKTPTLKNLSLAYRFLDRAAKTNLIHKNKAARLKSRLAKLLKEKPTIKIKAAPKKPSK